jgi:hypothetical protein
MGMVFCRGCGKEIHETARSCPHCGAQQKTNSKGESDRDVSGVLLFLFGFLYLFFKGWFKAGLVYILIVCVSMGIGWFIMPFLAKKFVDAIEGVE